ncbi:hypothetical protein [Acidicapsa acidisoli]|uniref:hypothetical protein n=1 Tax=Acidicapsa acidisoli TaxID=1615681 RepID=UPI0021E0A404|nr:hypothetical protein [Acidicapsa acidisoli]
MAKLLLSSGSIFPFDPAIDSQMGHRHLIMIYCAVWGTQLAYVGYIAYKRWSLRKD